ncbi:MAG: FIST C-terminal domain-containing protein [Ktedonobacteraceae bacterium]|nr:FIST C-terminal domain-containing protein [Ktedonobacteraceae bacterium]
MNEVAVVHTAITNSHQAGISLGLQIRENLLMPPDIIILFAAPQYNHRELLQVLKQSNQTTRLVGCSSGGEFTSNVQGTGLACAVALYSDEMSFATGLGRSLSEDRARAADNLTTTFHRSSLSNYHYHTILLLADGLSGCVESTVQKLTVLTGGMYEIFGGGASDNGLFSYTPVFYDTEVVPDALVALEIHSQKPLGIGVQHGWRPASSPMRITGAKGMNLISLDNKPAIEAFRTHAKNSGQIFDERNPLLFFLHNSLGIEGTGYRLRIPVSINSDGSLRCASEIPANSRVVFMNSTATSPIEAARNASNEALRKLYGCKPAAGLFFDCVATRITLGTSFGFELEAVQSTLGDVPFAGCNTHGQIARAQGQFSTFHNCTAVVCLIPE